MKKNRTRLETGQWIFRRKTFLVMKLTLLLVLCALFQVRAEVFSQRKVSMQMKEVTLDHVFRELSRQIHCEFLYNNSIVKQKGNVSIDVKNEELDKLLNDLLPQLGMEYVMDEDVIIIRERLPQSVKEVELKGTVRDEDGMVLPGATVRIKGTNLGVATGTDGSFLLRVPEAKDIVLTVSFIGMKSQEFKYAGQKQIEVVLYADKQEMDEVVVTGYQVIDKRTLTSSITTIKADDLEKMGALTIDQMLEGKAPGLMITNVSAQPGAAAKVRIRASGTFTGSREPLWVIDGVIYEDPVPLTASEINSLDNVNLIGNAITGLNPLDIESINILKDASATAIYGTRAANGVIVVTTRRGKVGSAVVTYSGSMDIVNRPRYSDFKLMNSKERVDVSREMYERGLVFPTVGPNDNYSQTPLAYEKALLGYWKNGNFGQFQNEVSRLEMLNYDWFGELYRPAVNSSHSVNVSGGTENARYYFSVGYDNQKGTELGVDLNRLTARTNIDVDLRKNVLLSFGIDGSVQKAKYNHSSLNLFDEAYYTSRAVEARDEAGLVYIDKVITQAYNTAEYGHYNILNERDNSLRRIDNKAFNFNIGLNWEIVKGIKLSSRFAYRNTTNLTEEWVKENTFYMAKLRSYDEFRENLDETMLKVNSLVPFGGIYSGGQTSQEAMSIRNQLNFIKVLHDKHVFNLNITQEASSTQYRGATNWEAPGYNHEQGRKFISLPSLMGNNTSSGVNYYPYQSALKWLTSNTAAGHSIYPTITERTTNMMSWVGIFTYSYDDRYIANFNIRSDGSNAFGQYERYKFKPSWSASVRWNIHNENILKNVEQVNELAFKASYGFRGTSPSASPYLLLTNYGHNVSAYNPENTSSLASFPNANLRWEKTATLNTGITYSFFGNRLSGSLEYAYSKGTDLLLTRPVSLVNGSSSQLYNGGTKNDHTIEFDIRGEVIKTKKLQWNVNFNLSRVKENILTGTNVVAGSVSVDDYLNGTILMKGFPVDGFFSYKYGGLDKTGAPIFPALNEQYGSDYQKLQNLLVYEGNRLPQFYGGFGTEVSFKGFTLTAYFSYKAGQKVRLLDLYKDRYMPLSGDNMRSEFVNRWRQEGDEAYTDIPVLSNNPRTISENLSKFIPKGGTSLYNLYDLSDLRTAKGDYIRWQSLTLSYRCPASFLKMIGLKALIVRLQTQNLAVWAFDKKIKGQDPEQVRSVGLPTLPTYNLGLTVSF